MRISIILLSLLVSIGCAHRPDPHRTPSSAAVETCHDLLNSVIITDWRELWDKKMASGLDGDEALEWVNNNQKMRELIALADPKEREPIEYSYALIHAKYPDWSADQVATHYKLWQTSCGL